MSRWKIYCTSKIFWFPTRSFDAVAVPFRPAPALIHHFMALPLLLIDDAVHAIALLGGRDGLKLDQLFPRLPRLPKADDACKAFIWRKLCSHPELAELEGRQRHRSWLSTSPTLVTCS